MSYEPSPRRVETLLALIVIVPTVLGFCWWAVKTIISLR